VITFIKFVASQVKCIYLYKNLSAKVQKFCANTYFNRQCLKQHVARMDDARGVYRVLVGKPEGKRPLGRPRRRWGIILRCISRRWDVGIWTVLGWSRIGTGSGRL
jgi:hypothetical protein